jgi:hypothetical protein
VTALGDIPTLAADPEYAADPVHEADATDEAILTPDEELGVQHIFGDRPFTVQVEIPRWNMTVRYRVLDDRELMLCDDGAQEAASESSRTRLLGIHYLTRAVVDIGGEPPIGDATEDTLGARFAYFLSRKGPVKTLLLTHFFQVQARFWALLNGESVPKS